MSQSALRAQRRKEMDATKEAEKLLQRESDLEVAEKIKERLMAASLGRTDALRMTPQQLKKLGITIVYTSSPKKTPRGSRGSRGASAVAEGGRSRRLRRVHRHRSHRNRMTHRRKHHATRRRSMKGGESSEKIAIKNILGITGEPDDYNPRNITNQETTENKNYNESRGTV